MSPEQARGAARRRSQEGICRTLINQGEALRRTVFIPLIVLTLLLAGCKSTYYKTMRTLGKEKRDILVQRIKDAKKDQDQTKQQLKTTMESFQALTGFQGGSLEKSYKRLNSDYESANSQAGKLHDRIQSIDQVSNDLFKEWQSEIGAMDNGKLKSQDTVMLRDAKARQATYMLAMRRTEDEIAPVLKAFRDQVLFLKHNLNARAIGSLKSTSATLKSDVATLVKSIDASSQEADKLISTLAASDSQN
jgi:outer membrane murein-binding lipoprotein Lpp